MAALLRGVARSIAVVAAARSGARRGALVNPNPFLAVVGGASVRGSAVAAAEVRNSCSGFSRRAAMASLPGFCGTGLSRPVLSSSGGSSTLSSSSSVFLAYRRLSMQQVKPIAIGNTQVSAFQLKSQDGQTISVRESNQSSPTFTHRERPREPWAPTSSISRIPDENTPFTGSGSLGRSFNSRPRPMPVRNIGTKTRFVKSTSPNELFQDTEFFSQTGSPFKPSTKEFSSSALLEGFDDNEGPEMDVETYKKTHDITTTGADVPEPFMTFASTGFPPTLMRELETAGFSSPSAIQAMTWPIAGQGKDVVAIAKTGSGKTLGYLLPAFLKMENERAGSRRNPTVLVLAPTRELANQIRDEVWKFGRSSRVSCTCVCGGSPKGPQLRDIERGVDLIVATPGRLNDLLEMRAVNLQKVSYLVLDEADRMLDMGFEPQIRAIVDQMSPKRQTLMYTATWPHEVRRIARDLMTDPVQVNIGNSDVLSANKNITQVVEVVSRFDKDKRLEEILSKVEEGSKVLIFCTTKRMCDELAMSIRNKFGALALHGDKSQRERDYVMSQFKRGRTPVLVATDVAARGLDIKDIRMVLNYDFPTCVEDYVHRIGRTGRAGATGVAHTFFGFEDSKHAGELIKVLESTGQEVSQELRQMSGRSSFGRVNSRYNYGGRGGGFRSQPSHYSGRSDGFNSGSKWGSGGDRFGSDRFSGGDRFGGDRFGSDNKFGGDRFGSDNKFGGDRFGGDQKFGSDRFGNDSKFGSNRFGSDRSGSDSKFGNDRFGSDRFGSDSKFGSDRFGSGNKFGSDRFGGDSKFGSNKFGSNGVGNDRLGNDQVGGRFGLRDSTESLKSGSTEGKFGTEFKDSNGGILGSKWGQNDAGNDRPVRPPAARPVRNWKQNDLDSLKGLSSLDDNSMLKPNYGELKMNPDGTMSLW